MSDCKDNISRNNSFLHITEVNNNSTCFDRKTNRNILASCKLNPSLTEHATHSAAARRRNKINSPQTNDGQKNEMCFTNSLILSRNNSITKKNKPVVVVVTSGKKFQEASRD